MPLFLRAIGLYAVAFAVAQRRREIGIRTARRGSATGHADVLLRGLRLSFFGLVLGLTLSYMLRRIMNGLTEGGARYSGPDARLLGALVAAVVIGVAAVAAWIPARRAAGVDPARVLNRG